MKYLRLILPAIGFTARAQAQNLEKGKEISTTCAGCDAKSGNRCGMFPMLVGQYTSCLKRQIEKYLKGERPHDETGVGGILITL